MNENPGLLIHYGANKYKPEAVRPIKNFWVKPKGGLWTSPVTSQWGWKDWCVAEEFRTCTDENSFRLALNDGAKVFVIDSFKDLRTAPFVGGTTWRQYHLDFEAIAREFDAIWLTEKGQQETRLSHPFDLYGWDCESVLILNPYCCKQVHENELVKQ